MASQKLLFLLYFVRSGNVGIHTSWPGYRNGGQAGNWWSSTPHSNGINGYALYFNATGVYPSGNYGRYFGFSLRCQSREGAL